MKRVQSTKSRVSFKQHVLRPVNFLTIIVTSLAITMSLVILLIIVLVKPYEQPQDIRQQARQIQDCLTMIDLPRAECEALTTLYESTNGAGWTINAGEIAWFSTPKACEWLGIACSGNPNLERPEPLEKNVIAINLPSRRMSGTLPPVWDSFNQLAQIDFSNNSISGSIENSGLFGLKSLTSVNLSNNRLDGYLPDVFSGDHALVSLNISRNIGLPIVAMPLKPLPVSLAKVQSLKQLIINNTLLGTPIPLAYKELNLNVFLTADTELCLPDSLKSWYELISKKDTVRFCSVTTPTLSPTLTKTPTPTPTGRPSATPTPTGVNGTGGTTTVGCNQNCDSNADCGINLRCYDIDGSKRCRLATNPSNESCQEIADQGLNFACNQYCSDSTECAGDLTCWYNRCREAANVTSISCTPASSELQELMQHNCGQNCASNRDCVVNMRCYNGSCRLATNPTSQTCNVAPPTKRVVATPTNSQSKGGLGGPSVTPKLSVTPGTASDSANLSVESTVTPTQTPIVSAPEPPSEPGLFEQIKNWFSQIKLPMIDGSGFLQFLQSKGLLIGLVVAGVVFLILGFVTGKKQTSSKSSRLTAPPTIRTADGSQTGMMEKKKKKGITPLK